MSSSSAPKAVSGPPAFPPEPVTPTRGAGKGKCTSAAAELTPHGPCAGPSSAGPSATSFHAPKATMASCTSSQGSASPAPPVLPQMEPPAEEIPPPCHKHTRNLLKVFDHSINILNAWSGLMWSTKRDQMHLACSLLVLNRIATNNRWHTMPFKDTPNAPTLTSECRGLFPTPGNNTPDTTHRSADKAGPQTQTPSLPPAHCASSLPPAHCAPSETTARPSHAQHGPPPPQPLWSNWCPPP
jgi:hypothetical protein